MKGITTALVAAGTLGLLLYMSKKGKANGSNGGPSPEPSPAPPPGNGTERELHGIYCCDPGGILSGRDCIYTDLSTGAKTRLPAKVCPSTGSQTISRITGNGDAFNRKIFRVAS